MACATSEPTTAENDEAGAVTAGEVSGEAADVASEPSAAAPAEREAPPAAGVATAAPSPIAVPQPEFARLAEAAALGDEAARAELVRLAAEPDGAAQDQAALALGGLLVSDESWREALGPLREAAGGEVASDYAALLFARAVVRGRLADAVDEARTLLAPVTPRADTPFLAAEARLRAFQLETLAGAWPEAARQGLALLAATPPPEDLDEVRWLTAEALRLSGRTDEAVEIYRTIWRETPGSARAREARERLAAAGVEVEPPEGAERLAWIEAMQSAGLHREALDRLLATDTGTGYRAASLYWLARLAEPPDSPRAVELYRTLRRE
ncbi:MAG TPA: hypothetical protein VHM02_14515, partial [Thermoanaerobaculia bacterium]|nr:hypothetical protein [Thermoanaerobaculia bacterium]